MSSLGLGLRVNRTNRKGVAPLPGTLSAGLRSLYTFEQGSNPQLILDSSGRNNNGTNGRLPEVEGMDGVWVSTGLQFDGVSQTSRYAPVDLSTGFTFTSVFAINGPAGGAYHGLIGGASGVGHYTRLLLYGTNGNSMLMQASATHQASYSAMPQAAIGEFRVYTAASDGANVKFYLNGTNVYTTTSPGPLSTTGAGSMEIGCGAPSANTYYANGIVAHTGIHGRMLDATEVAEYHQHLKTTLATRGITLP
jgi:hypothetical protein